MVIIKIIYINNYNIKYIKKYILKKHYMQKIII